MIAVSIVSHGHGTMVVELAKRLLAFPEISRIIVTLNVPERLALPEHAALECIENARPRGFGANHNAAFERCSEAFFCPLNPDIELPENPFPELLEAMRSGSAGVLAPLVRSPAGGIEDSARYFPTPWRIARKVLLGDRGCHHLAAGASPCFVEWVAGMFMLFERRVFSELKGFDERYFLYYEDADICLRSWKNGSAVAVVPAVSVIHDARRDSHRKLRHLFWHLSSMMRFFAVHYGRFPDIQRIGKAGFAVRD